MRTHVRAAGVLLLAVVLPPGCQEDADPLDSATTPATSTAPSSSPGSDSDGDTPDGTESGGSNPHEICERYLACIAAVSPGGLPEAQMGFGENGSCWQGSESEAQLCLDACQAGLEMFNQQFPEEAACGLCQTHSECDMAAGELCHLGQCTVTKCSNGIIDPGEICDSQPNCAADCKGPQECNPISGYGCSGFEACYLISKSPFLLGSFCLDTMDWAALGRQCGPDISNGCDPGLGCAPKELDPNCAATGDDGCCQALCDLGAPECEIGLICVPYQDVFGFMIPPELEFVGICVPS